MRKILLLLLVFMANVTLFAQNLTLAQLIEIKKKDLGNAEEYLTAKGWEFMEADAPTEEKYGQATFSYNKSVTSTTAESFLTYYYFNMPKMTWISIQISKINKYNEYINTLKSNGCKLISSEVKEGKILKVYRGETYTFLVETGKSTNLFDQETAVWHLYVLSNDDYKIIFGDK